MQKTKKILPSAIQALESNTELQFLKFSYEITEGTNKNVEKEENNAVEANEEKVEIGTKEIDKPSIPNVVLDPTIKVLSQGTDKRKATRDKEKNKRMKGQSSHATWKSETEMVLRQQFD